MSDGRPAGGSGVRPSGPADPGLEQTTRPVLGSDVTTMGELPGSGFRESQWLIRRGDRYLQISELLYRVAERADGSRTVAQIANEVTKATRWSVGPDQIRYLVEKKLVPLGIVLPSGESGVREGSPDRRTDRRSPLQVRARHRVLGPAGIERVTRVLHVLFRPRVAMALLIVVLLSHAWLYIGAGVMERVRVGLATPETFLIAVALLFASGVAHEFGHASGLRAGGGRARGMGAGVYLVFPTFYTDVTEAYRLGRRERIRTDIGGVYFHLILCSALIGVYAISGSDAVVLAVALIDLEVIRQFLPIGRLDGYWLMADITGVPDPLSQAIPFLRGLLGRSSKVADGQQRLPPLGRRSKLFFVAYLLLMAVALPVVIVLIAATLPSLASAAWASTLDRAGEAVRYWKGGDPAGTVGSVLGILLLGLQVFAMTYLVWALGWRPLRAIWTWSGGRRHAVRRGVRGGLVIGVGGFLVVSAAFAPWRLVRIGDLSSSSPAGVASSVGRGAAALGLVLVLCGVAMLGVWNPRLRRVLGGAAIMAAVGVGALVAVETDRTHGALDRAVRLSLASQGLQPDEARLTALRDRLLRLDVSVRVGPGLYGAAAGALLASTGAGWCLASTGKKESPGLQPPR
jgi:putative peptide zinc metalloprotease protein